MCSCFFSGGYENFHSQYPELCTEVKTLDQSGTETEKRVNNHSDKLSHRKPDYDQVWKHPTIHYLTLSHMHVFICNLVKKKHTLPSPSDIRENYMRHHFDII